MAAAVAAAPPHPPVRTIIAGTVGKRSPDSGGGRAAYGLRLGLRLGLRQRVVVGLGGDRHPGAVPQHLHGEFVRQPALWTLLRLQLHPLWTHRSVLDCTL